MTKTQIKLDLLRSVGWLADCEGMTKADEDKTVSQLAAVICSDSRTSHVATAMVALTLAKHIDQAAA